MRAVPTWFGAPDRPLLGWFHLPDDGSARGVAVLCGPLGRERANALPALQALGDRLARSGVATLRFDYAGTGDSAGNLDDPGRMADWVASIDHALALARSVNAGPVVVVGMRMGALLATEAVRHGKPVDGIVLWDPCASGREFLRIERTLLATGYGATQVGDGSVTGPAFTYGPETVEELTPLALVPTPDTIAARTLVLARSEGRSMPAARAAFAAPHIDWIEVGGQPDLLDVPPQLLAVPTTTIKAIAEWTAEVVDVPESAVHFEPVDRAVVATGPDGREIAERTTWLGPNRLFGVVTEPCPATGAGSPMVVLLPAGALDHTGPGRKWVDLARGFAADGIPTLRVDFDGIGESYGRSGFARQIPKPPESIDDLEDLAAALGDPEGRNLIFVGLSSGGYHAVEAGLHLHPLGVCAINPALSSWVPEVDQLDPDEPGQGFPDARRRAYRPMPEMLKQLEVKHRRVADRLWRVLLQVRVTHSPAHAVAGVSRRGTPVLLINSASDAVEFEPSAYWSLVTGRLHRHGLLDVEVVPGDDHSLYTLEGQRDAYPLLTRWIVDRAGTGSTTPG
jgi:alpha-beta hydrolase superfamily lysophospholipase